MTADPAQIAKGRDWYRKRKLRRYWTQTWISDPEHPFGGYWNKTYRGPLQGTPQPEGRVVDAR